MGATPEKVGIVVFQIFIRTEALGPSHPFTVCENQYWPVAGITLVLGISVPFNCPCVYHFILVPVVTISAKVAPEPAQNVCC